jgi:hypothetical protein
MVTLVGPNSPTFAACISALNWIHRFFDEFFSVGEVRAYEHSVTAGMDSIIAGTHMLTSVHSHAWRTAEGGMTASIDPDGVLQSVVNMGKFWYTEDNVVNYWEMALNEDDK